MSVLSIVSHVLADVTPAPTPTIVGDNVVTPGPWGFLATAFVALATIGLIYDAVRRMRRVRYKDEIDAKLQAELAEKRAEAAASND